MSNYRSEAKEVLTARLREGSLDRSILSRELSPEALARHLPPAAQAKLMVAGLNGQAMTPEGLVDILGIEVLVEHLPRETVELWLNAQQSEPQAELAEDDWADLASELASELAAELDAAFTVAKHQDAKPSEGPRYLLRAEGRNKRRRREPTRRSASDAEYASSYDWAASEGVAGGVTSEAADIFAELEAQSSPRPRK